MIETTAATTTSSNNKRIRFAANDAVYPIVHVNDMTNHELKNCYYSRNEMTSMKQNCADIIEFARYINERKEKQTKHDEETVKNLSGLKLFTRGLERHVCEKTATLRKERMETSVQDVLEEQHFGNSAGMCCENVIAKLYSQISRPCQQDAYERGLNDERIAINAYDNDGEDTDDDEIDNVDEYLSNLKSSKQRNNGVSSLTKNGFGKVVWASSSSKSSGTTNNKSSSSSLFTSLKKKIRRSTGYESKKEGTTSVGGNAFRLIQARA